VKIKNYNMKQSITLKKNNSKILKESGIKKTDYMLPFLNEIFGFVKGGAKTIIQAFLNSGNTIIVPNFYLSE